DGQPKLTGVLDTPNAPALASGGGLMIGGDLAGGQSFQGTIDEVRFFSLPTPPDKFNYTLTAAPGNLSTAVAVLVHCSGNRPPTDIALDNSSVAENKPAGTAVGNFSTTDPDVGDTFTYSLVSGTGSTDNGSFQIVGNQLQTAASFD